MRSARHSSDATLVVEGVNAGYGTGPDVLTGLSLTLDGPGLTRLTGRNGAGKSTFVELVSGYLRPRSGTIAVRGTLAHLPAARELRRICRSHVALHPAMTVTDHLALAAMSSGVSIVELLARAEEWGMSAWLDHRTCALSTGNARKTWTLLCTVGRFDLAVLDEPYDGLDDGSRRILSRWLSQWAQHAQVILVAHENHDELGLGGAVTDPPVVIGQVVRTIAWGTFGLLLALACRSQIGAIVAVLGGAFLIEPMLRGIVVVAPQSWATDVPQFLPFTVMDSVVPRGRGTGAFLAMTGTVSPAVAAAVSALYIGVLALIALWVLRAPGAVHASAAVA